MQILELFSVVMHNYCVQRLTLWWRRTQHHSREISVWLWFVFVGFFVKSRLLFFFFLQYFYCHSLGFNLFLRQLAQQDIISAMSRQRNVNEIGTSWYISPCLSQCLGQRDKILTLCNFDILSVGPVHILQWQQGLLVSASHSQSDTKISLNGSGKRTIHLAVFLQLPCIRK